LCFQTHFLPVAVFVAGAAEVGARGRVAGFPADAEAGEVGVAEFGFAAGGRFSVVFAGCPSLCGGLDAVEGVVDFVFFEARAEAGGDGTRDSVAFVALVEDVEEGEGGVFVNSGLRTWIHQIPRTS